MAEAPVFWMTDPEADAIKSPFVRQPHYNDLQIRNRKLEAEIARRDKQLSESVTHEIEYMTRITEIEAALRRLRRWAILNIAVTPANDADLPEWRATMHDVDLVLGSQSDAKKGDEE